ncbi:MAG: right-handed parallel beta-helix repeat-containing protein, partial [Anaerolineae bacterium]
DECVPLPEKYTLGEYDQTIGHVIIQGLSMQNGSWGIDAQHSHDIVIRDNTITDVDYGVINRRGDGLESNQTVWDNVVEGRTEWPGSGSPSERGIDLRGYGNVVCHNQVRYFGDCISLQPFTGPSYGNDVFGNDVAYCVDDGIEIDYNQANVRVWRNRVTNARMGVSLQPIRGGPAYVLRNEFFNLESVPIKMHNYTAGFIVVHNSGAKHGNGYGDNGAMWRNAILRNNLFLGTRYAFEFTTVADEGFRDFDYNAWGTTREIDPGGPFFKWDDVRFATLGDLPPGVEDHGVEAAFGDLLDGALPADWDVAVGPGTRDLRLRAGAPEIDAGVDLPNLNNGFAISGAPDAGAFETGQALPHYGPRSVVPDLSGSSKRADRLAARLGDTLSFTILIQNAGAPLNGPIALTDTLPSGLSYVSDTLTATSGAADDTLAPVLRWTGELDGNSEITLTYSATVVEEARRVISNTATIDAGPLGSLNLSAMLIVNGYSHFLPVCYSRSSP